jgi:DNA-binding CsgD family transcriptional regulator
VLAGLTGDAGTIVHHLDEAWKLAEELRSPLHQLRVAEPRIEYLASTGEWQSALELAENTVESARALGQRSSLARLLVWTALLRLGRGELARGKAYVDEAWQLSGAGDEQQPPNVHTVVPAHVGMAAYHVAAGDFHQAARIGEAGLTIADRTGYTAWAVHRLLPTLAEAYLFLGDLDGAARTGQRLRADSERLGHSLGLAWADACDALLVWLRGDIVEGIDRLSAAADRLEAVPAVPDAARLRRHFAARLRDYGQREAALKQLRDIHEVFVRLGAERELAKTRDQIRELGARPPLREVSRGIGGLSGREVEIASLAAKGKTNKAIARILGISPRTVSTHLSNIFAKIEVESRGELAEYVRQLEG